ncbi:diguanylate cyclase [Synechocystis salina LEGE 06155]|nr:diguanylate cyclase [Synechocystis salina LEGE 06155]
MMKVLVVEDELLIARDLSQRLKKNGFEVVGVASSGVKVHELIAAKTPDLVLMDIVIKGDKDGITLAEEVHKLYGLPIIFLTAYADDQTLQRSEQSGAYGYILKPFNDAELLVTIRLALQKHQQYKNLYQQSTRDALTGLFNRRFLEETLGQEEAKFQRHQREFSIILLDIDHFKQFNDTYGHAAGDYVLQRVGDLLQNRVRQMDLVCRYGGEEMLILLPECELRQAGEIAESIRSQLSTMPLSYEDTDLGQVTVSVGVACYPHHGATGGETIRTADQCLYQAKQNGRNRVVLAAIAPNN